MISSVGSKIPSQYMTSGTHEEDGIVLDFQRVDGKTRRALGMALIREGYFRLATGNLEVDQIVLLVSIGITVELKAWAAGICSRVARPA
jgi:hypothetical protein